MKHILDKLTHTHITNKDAKLPGALKTAQEIAELTGIHIDRIIELADGHFLPHWKIDGGEAKFQAGEVKNWIAKNLLERINGNSYPIELKVMVKPPLAISAPESIREIDGLRQIPIDQYPPGVYFLVEKDEVVYIGQSRKPMIRIGQHPDKQFSRVYYIPAPSSDLHSIEGALIRAITPKLNLNENNIIIARGSKTEDIAYIEKYAKGLPVKNSENQEVIYEKNLNSNF